MGAGGQSPGGCSGDNGLRKVWESSEQVLGIFLNPLRPGGLSGTVTVAGGSQAMLLYWGVVQKGEPAGMPREQVWARYGGPMRMVRI